jgi:hypothetical protein
MDLGSLIRPLPHGAGRIGLLSSDEFLPRARPFDDALMADRQVSQIGVLLCADHRAAHQSLDFARRHFPDREVFRVFASCGPDELPDMELLYLAGGDPRSLAMCVQERPGFWGEVLERWRAGLMLAGSSAGAMMLCGHAIGACTCTNPEHEWGDGLGPVEGIGLAVHADRRDPEWLAHLPSTAREPVIAMDEGTGIILDPGSPPRTVGEGRIWKL